MGTKLGPPRKKRWLPEGVLDCLCQPHLSFYRTLYLSTRELYYQVVRVLRIRPGTLNSTYSTGSFHLLLALLL
jgi:hypothetical protein